MIRIKAFIPLALAGTVSLPSCDLVHPAGPGELWIGAAGPWGHPSSVPVRRGLVLGLESVNNSGGIDGRSLRIHFEDDGYGSDSRQIARSAAALIEDERILGVIGHTRSAPTHTAATQYLGRLPLISPMYGLPASMQSDWSFSLVTPDATIVETAARWAEAQGWSQVVVLADNSPRGRDFAPLFSRSFRGTILREQLIGPIWLTGTFQPEAEMVARLDPDFIFAATSSRTVAHLLEAFAAEGIAPRIVGIELLAPLKGNPAADGVVVVAPSRPSPGARRSFDRRYRDRFGEAPTFDAALAYDGVLAAAAALRTGARSREELARALGDVSIEGVTGPISFDNLGRRRDTAAEVMRIQGDTLDPVRP